MDICQTQIPLVTTRTPCRVFLIHTVRQLHNTKVLAADPFRLIIVARSGKRQQHTLGRFAQAFMIRIDHFSTLRQRHYSNFFFKNSFSPFFWPICLKTFSRSLSASFTSEADLSSPKA